MNALFGQNAVKQDEEDHDYSNLFSIPNLFSGSSNIVTASSSQQLTVMHPGDALHQNGRSGHLQAGPPSSYTPQAGPSSSSRGFSNAAAAHGYGSAVSFSFPNGAASNTLSPLLNQPGLAAHVAAGPIASSERSDSEEPHSAGNNKRKGAGSSNDARDESATDGPDRPKKKRNRAVLSCVPCKARKIKCDRMLPCESCVKRGLTEECRWEDIVKVPPPQPFASAIEVAALTRRLKAVEEKLARFPADFTLEASAGGTGASVKVKPAPPAPAAVAQAQEPDDHLDDHDEQQAAVGALEELALGELVLSARPNMPLMRSSKNWALCSAGPGVQSGPASCAADATPEGSIPAHRTQSTIFLPRISQPAVPGLTQFLMETSPAGTLRTVMKALPSKEVTNVLWGFYYNEYTWACEYECKTEAQREYADFWQWIESGGSIDLIDPAWLAFLFSKLAFASRAAPAEVHERAFGDLTLIDVLPEQFFRASKRCLEIAQWNVKPQFRVLSCLLSYVNMLFYSLDVTEAVMWQPAAMRLAEIMGIHKLGSNAETMPQWDDLAFPTGPSFRKRQLCCRAWHALLFTDGLFSMDFGFSKFVPPDHDTLLPLNFDDAELLTDDIHYRGKSLEIFTDGYKDCFRHRLLKIWETSKVDKPSYELVMSIDRDFRTILGEVPVEVKTALPGKIGVSRTAVAFRCLLTCGIHSQLIKLHMPFLYRSYKNPRFKQSHDICITSAEAVIAAERDYTLISREQRYWWTYVQLFAAVLCLLLDTLHLTDQNGSERLVEERLSRILLALPSFDTAQRTARIPQSKRIGYVGSYVINAMVAVLRERQSGRLENPKKPQESYAQLFERITATLKQTTPSNSDFSSPAAPMSFNIRIDNSFSAAPQVRPETRLWTDPGASTDLLQSMGLSLDSLFGPASTDVNYAGMPNNANNTSAADFSSTPSNGSGSNWPTPGVFDSLFGSSELFGAGLPVL